MRKITEKKLIELGWEKQIVEPEIKPNEDSFYYFTYEINGKTILITNANNDRIGKGFDVEFFDFPYIIIKDLKKLKKLMKIIKSCFNGE